MKKGSILLVVCLTIFTFAFGDIVGSIRGSVVAAETNDPLMGVNILVEDTRLGAFTDLTGYYNIINLPVGEYTVTYMMIGYKKVIQRNVRVIRDQSTIINVRMDVEAVQGEVVEVIAERPSVEKDVVGRKVTMETEQVINLPVRDMTEVYTLQSGIIEIKTADLGIPGFEERGIEQIHVRGGRANETGFMIDGMYIENPIYGGKGKGTRLNQFAVAQVDFQTGFFNSEYGDAMSGMINTVTRTGPEKLTGMLRYELSNFGGISSDQDQLRDFSKIAGGFGGPLFTKNIRWWTSFDMTKQAYGVYKFDDLAFDMNDPLSDYNTDNHINPLDTVAGWRSFGFDNTFDIFSKMTFLVSPKIRLNLSHWYVNSNYKAFDPAYIFYDLGKNEVEKISKRYAVEWRHQIDDKTYYTLNYSDFTQEMTMGVRNYDTDGDGYPDWVEQRYWADFYDSTKVPYMDDGSGTNIPLEYVISGTDTIWNRGDELTDWLTADQYNQPYVVYPFIDEDMIIKYQNSPNLYNYAGEFYYTGADRYYHYTKSRTRELRVDVTSQVGRYNQIKGGVDYKTHQITFDEVQLPWLSTPYTENYYRVPQEFSGYIQDKIEYPWMVINAGLRFDAANSNDSMWADPRVPEATLYPTTWEFLWSPRLGFSHVITDKSTFTFGYGIYYQNPTYRDIYNNIDERDNLDEFFNTPLPLVGNPSVSAQKVTSYEFGLNTEILREYVLGIVGWSKDYSNMNSTEQVRVGSVTYTTFVNYDYGSARGLDLIFEKRRGKFFTGNLQYTYSVAMGNRSDPWEGYRNGENPLTMPKNEVLQDYDRTHDFSAQLTFRVPKGYGIPIGNYNLFQNTMTNLTFIAISGAPYTPILPNDQAGPQNSERMPAYYTTNLAFRKYIDVIGKSRVVLGFVCTNLFNRKNALYVYPRTGDPDNPGGVDAGYIQQGLRSSSFYDRPWYYDDYRSLDLFVEVEF
ncbi:MAG: carboxypeptidase-like regulatory domain-containing protein [Candidatus Marinimicrobia bacterium]|nr:carboxypeptidase-like regulatory domain-containing protein [Candidatus Neomarinimicrobiota bacterium]